MRKRKAEVAAPCTQWSAKWGQARAQARKRAKHAQRASKRLMIVEVRRWAAKRGFFRVGGAAGGAVGCAAAARGLKRRDGEKGCGGGGREKTRAELVAGGQEERLERSGQQQHISRATAARLCACYLLVFACKSLITCEANAR